MTAGGLTRFCQRSSSRPMYVNEITNCGRNMLVRVLLIFLKRRPLLELHSCKSFVTPGSGIGIDVKAYLVLGVKDLSTDSVLAILDGRSPRLYPPLKGPAFTPQHIFNFSVIRLVAMLFAC